MSDKSLDEKTREFGEKDFGEREEFGAENLESYSVENDRETMSSNKRIKEMPIDWLGALPDSLIIHILSFLETKEAAITSVLSKRWRFLWTESPRLGFEEISWETWKIRVFVTRVHRILVACSGNYLEHFGVDFRFHKCFASDVDAWLEFTIRSKVKVVSLRLHSNGDLYTLPQMMYSNSSLTSLWMQGCIMAPQRTIEWQSLTSLEIQEVEVPQLVVEKILSGCPVLYCLVLRECWGFNRLEVNSQSLYKLGVYDCDDADNKPLLEISAPYILSLDISLYPVGRKLQFLDISSLVRAGMDFTGPYWYSSDADVMSNTKELFENVQHVQELEVGWQCFDVVSMLAVNGWQLPQSWLKGLTVKASSNDGSSISGIIGLLESSPNLETLVIEGFHPIGALDTWDPPVRGDMVCDLLHLKTVTITEFGDPKFGGEPMVTLTRILLKRATVLEKMVIEFDVENISDFDKIGQKLLTFPRFSQKALVQLSYQL